MLLTIVIVIVLILAWRAVLWGFGLMLGLFFGVLAILWLIMAAPASSTELNSTWEDTCAATTELYNVTCDGITAPPVLSANLPEGMHGAVHEGKVYWSWELRNRPDIIEGIVIHEYAHYILHEAGFVPMTSPESICLSEGYAHEVEARHWRKVKYYKMLKTTTKWWRYYDNCSARHAQ